jgi:hypothetical protein
MREWYVIRLGRGENTTKAHWFDPNNQQAQLQGPGELAPAGAARRPRREGEENLNFRINDMRQQAAAPQQQQGFGYYIKPEREDFSGIITFTDHPTAVAYAAQQASMNPKVQYGVFECVEVYETTEPVVIVKSYNDGGELVIQQAQQEELAHE